MTTVLACYVNTQICRPSQLRQLGGRWEDNKRDSEEYIAEEWVKVKVMGKFEDILLWEGTDDHFIRSSGFYRSSF
jgi:hypothetical protein